MRSTVALEFHKNRTPIDWQLLEQAILLERSSTGGTEKRCWTSMKKSLS